METFNTKKIKTKDRENATSVHDNEIKKQKNPRRRSKTK